MTITEQIIEKLRQLPPEKQKAVLDYVGSLDDSESQIPLHDARGLWKGLGFDVTEEDIAEMRKEMWRNFPRDPR